jgi:CHAD domain-containing protein
MKHAQHIQWDDRAGAAVNAKRKLPPLVSDYFTRARDLLAADRSPAKLHRLRLATKRLRYTLELFRSCYGPGLDSRLAVLRKVQQILGEVNDSVTAGERLSKMMKHSPQRTRVKNHLEGRATGLAAEFRKLWKEEFDAPGQEIWWTTYLARNARAAGKRSA